MYPGKLDFHGFHFDWEIVKKIYMVGIPSAIMISMPSLLVGALNSILAAFSGTAIAAFGLYIKIQSFVYMPANGVVQGMRPIMSYNYGGRQQEADDGDTEKQPPGGGSHYASGHSPFPGVSWVDHEAV